MRRSILGVVALVAVIFGWHLLAARDVRTRAEELAGKRAGGATVALDPLSNLVTISAEGEPTESKKDDDPLSAFGRALGSALGGAVAAALEPSMERELNLKARERYDLYAILLPYRVKIVMPGSAR